MSALWPRINVSLQAVAQILLVIGLGAWLSARRNLDRKAIAAVSIVNWHVLIPALMFSSIVGAVTPNGLLLLWPLMVLSLLHVALGVIPALFLGWITRLPKDMFFFTVMTASLPNCGNLPWLFMPTIIRYYTPVDQVAAQIQYSTGLTSVYTIVVVLITLTVPFLFKKPSDTLVLPRNSSLVLPRNHSNVSLGTQEDEGDSTDLAPHQHDDDTHQQQQQQQQQGRQNKDTQDQQQQRGSSAGATAWVVPAGAAVKAARPAAAAAIDVHSDHNDQARADCFGDQSRADTTVRTGVFPGVDGLQGQDVSVFQQQQQQQQQQQRNGSHRQHDHSFNHQPSVGGADSFSSHRSSSFLLSHSRQLLGTFSQSFSRGVKRGVRRSASFVQLVWSYPTGWQPQRGGGDRQRPLPQEVHGSRPAWLQRLSALWAAVLAHPVVNLPLGATVVGIACAAVGPVRGVLVNELAPLHWLWLGLGWVGAAAAPIATMQIGAELMQTAPTGDSMHVSRRVQWTANTIAIVVKLIVVPLVNIALLRLGGLSKLVPESDTVYQLLMLVEAAVPAAVTLLVCCSRVYPDIRPLSSMLFWQYVVSLFTLPAFLVWYLYMLEL